MYQVNRQMCFLPQLSVSKGVKSIYPVSTLDFHAHMTKVDTLKQNGHPVSSEDISLIGKERLYPKEACDARTQYSTLFPLSSTQYYQSDSYARFHLSSYRGPTRQAISTHLSRRWTEGIRCSQLDPAQNSGS